jgi:dipeptidyl-peptidase-4
MKIKNLITVLFLALFSLVNAQQKPVTLADIYSGAFRQDYMTSLYAMKDGEHYAEFKFDRATETASVVESSYKTLKKTQTIVNSADLDEIAYFTSYSFSDDEQKMLLLVEADRGFRYSTFGIYYIYDRITKKATKLSDDKVQEPTFSPDGLKVAYVFDNNIYVKNLLKNTTKQITFDGRKNAIINGVTDWVYEEEFAFVRAFEWNKNSDMLAYLRFDERKVPEFSMMKYDENLYPEVQTFKYPKAGENNSKVTVHAYNFKEKKICNLNIDLGNYEYIPRIKWTASPYKLSVITLNRHQNDLKLFFIDGINHNIAKVILNEKNNTYIDITDNLTFLADNSFLWTSEQDGFNHIYHYSKKGKLINQVTKGNWEVTNFYGYDKKNKRLYYQSTENGSTERTIYSIGLGGNNKKLLSKTSGNNSADFATTYKYYINTYNDKNTPNVYTLNDGSTGSVINEIKNNNALSKALEGYIISPKEFSVLHTENGQDLNMWMIKPANFDSTKKYPLFIYQYSGPGNQQVLNRFMYSNDYWYQMLANEGYIVACIDPRGTGGKGAKFKKVTYKELGKYEVEDQISAAKTLGNLDYIDSDRIGIWGWSYGGFMSSNCLFKGADTFKMAIAVAPVTSWRFYDSVYTERYMQTPQENPSGYDNNSPLFFADKLKGKLLLIHGTGDDNVHVQNSFRLVNALVAAGKNFDSEFYPDRSHGIYEGRGTRKQLYTRMTAFVLNNL